VIAQAETFPPGSVVDLVNVNSGLSVVTVFHRSKRIQTPNPTRAVILAGPCVGEVSGFEFYHVRLTDGPHQGKLVSCSPAVIRFVARGETKPDRSKRRRNWLRVLQ
jgi:hypothetical protein